MAKDKSIIKPFEAPEFPVPLQAGEPGTLPLKVGYANRTCHLFL